MLRDREERTNLAGWLEDVSPGTELKSVMTDNTSHLVMSNISLSTKVRLKNSDKTLILYFIDFRLSIVSPKEYQ